VLKSYILLQIHSKTNYLCSPSFKNNIKTTSPSFYTSKLQNFPLQKQYHNFSLIQINIMTTSPPTSTTYNTIPLIIERTPIVSTAALSNPTCATSIFPQIILHLFSLHIVSLCPSTSHLSIIPHVQSKGETLPQAYGESALVPQVWLSTMLTVGFRRNSFKNQLMTSSQAR